MVKELITKRGPGKRDIERFSRHKTQLALPNLLLRSSHRLSALISSA
jgi:hypothetical protein